jgi:hypothetical protein
MPAPAVVIAASNLMASLRQRLADDGELLVFPDTEPIQALQAILEHRPSLIVLERLFAATPRGAALINRVKNDPQLAHAEIRVVSHSGDYSRLVTRRERRRPRRPAAASSAGGAGCGGGRNRSKRESPVASPAAGATARLAWHAAGGARRASGMASRFNSMAIPARVVDLSAIGAQVISATILRPNQKVRVSASRATSSSCGSAGRLRGRCSSWPGAAPRPSIAQGVEFIDADAAALERFGADAHWNSRQSRTTSAATIASARMIVSSRSEPVERMAAGTPGDLLDACDVGTRFRGQVRRSGVRRASGCASPATFRRPARRPPAGPSRPASRSGA